jgi:hypothetical protein
VRAAATTAAATGVVVVVVIEPSWILLPSIDLVEVNLSVCFPEFKLVSHIQL